jgi:hypothetical protein
MLRRTLGRVLLVLGITDLVFFSLAISGLGIRYLGRNEEITDHISRLGIVGPFITGALLVLGGFLLIEGKKHLILFLRPFNTIANERIMYAFAKKLGNSFSVIALDDGTIPAPRSCIREKLIALIIFMPAGLTLLFVSALALPMGHEEGSSLPSILACGVGLSLLRTTWRTAVPKSNKFQVSTERMLESAVAMARNFSTWGLRIFYPRSLILQSTNEMWKEAVEKLGRTADLVIIDISRMSQSIEWEMNFLQKCKAGKFLVACQLDVALPTTAPLDPTSVVTYKHSASVDRDFEKSLHVKLNALLDVPTPTGRE